MGKAAIAAKLGMSRITVHRLLGLNQPPRYQRRRAGSKRDPFCDAIAAMLREDLKLPATVIAPRLRRQGFTGSLTILRSICAGCVRRFWPRRPTNVQLPARRARHGRCPAGMAILAPVAGLRAVLRQTLADTSDVASAMPSRFRTPQTDCRVRCPPGGCDG